MTEPAVWNHVETLLKFLAALIGLGTAVVGLWQKRVENKKPVGVRGKRWAGLLLLGVAVFLLAVGLWFLRPKTSAARMDRLLSDVDASVFASGAPFEVARVFSNVDQLRRGSSLGDDLRGATRSFDLIANNAGALIREYGTVIEEIVRKGARVRILLSDPTEANAMNYDVFCRAIGENPVEVRAGALQMEGILRGINSRIGTNPGMHTGSLELRWNRRLILYTMWIANRGENSAIAHLGVHLYGGKARWVSFRFGRLSTSSIDALAAEFDTAWNSGTPAIASRPESESRIIAR